MPDSTEHENKFDMENEDDRENEFNYENEPPFIGCKMITIFTYRKRAVFLTDEVNEILCRSLTHHIENGHIIINGYVVMPNHIHLLMRPVEWTISRFVSNFKTYTGQKIKIARDFSRKVWRRRFYDEDITDYDSFIEHLEKLHNNPVKKGLVEFAEDYPWSSYSDYIGKPGRVPVSIDSVDPPSYTVY